MFALHSGWVTSKTDGDRHFIPAHRLVDLYELRPNEYVIWSYQDEYGSHRSEFRHLYPRGDGQYGRPRDA